jgi:membrane protease YdiL (CAAX protease family)
MSILPAVAAFIPSPTTGHSPTSMPSMVAAAEWLLWIVWTIVGLVVAKLLGAFKRGSVAGPVRLEVDASALDLLIVLCVALGAEIAGALLIMHHTSLEPSMKELIAGVVGKTFSIAAIALLLKYLRVLGVRSIGLAIHRLGKGIPAGALTLLILFPLVQLTMCITAAIYKLLQKNLPEPHPVLQRMGEAHNHWITITGFILAVLIAPFAEELFFRGILQTALTRCFTWMAYEISTHRFEDRPAFNESHPPRVGARWLGIAVTAAIFALFHAAVEPAAIPALFLLAAGLGYAYERTGNLWITITAHALFNSAQILLYLAMK